MTVSGHGLRRDLDLLEALASTEAQRAGGLGVVRLAEVTGREKSQVSRALKALALEGVVERDPDTLRYCMGRRLFRWSRAVPRTGWCGPRSR
ncbi:helix-turn-helix domain-containing protein [Amycolatopsis carbonis]|uniref:Helix-turn-helix domain-containing protein n=1 Tax=Amycolatopsis carbonis TaxID=715471 RepID=A0A9Y2IEZ4_9PSEU|nr:helix-turn-helix domain-containing protein [Amycolatopsis sp. 2-15]WIX77895.1 helix-turn-helix domain-containing protein [Amycolatopsis sp. 2-15]